MPCVLLIIFLRPETSDGSNDLFSELDVSIENMNKENRKANRELDEAKKEERQQQEKLEEEAKELEKMSNKQSMLIKKVQDQSSF